MARSEPGRWGVAGSEWIGRARYGVAGQARIVAVGSGLDCTGGAGMAMPGADSKGIAGQGWRDGDG